jgi:hypothetical protein
MSKVIWPSKHPLSYLQFWWYEWILFCTPPLVFCGEPTLIIGGMILPYTVFQWNRKIHWNRDSMTTFALHCNLSRSLFMFSGGVSCNYYWWNSLPLEASFMPRGLLFLEASSMIHDTVNVTTIWGSACFVLAPSMFFAKQSAINYWFYMV